MASYKQISGFTVVLLGVLSYNYFEIWRERNVDPVKYNRELTHKTLEFLSKNHAPVISGKEEEN